VIFVIIPIAAASLMLDILRTSSLGVREPNQITNWAAALGVYLVFLALVPLVCLVVLCPAQPCRECTLMVAMTSDGVAVVMAMLMMGIGGPTFDSSDEFESKEKFIAFAAAECLGNENIPKVPNCQRLPILYERGKFIGLEVMITSISWTILVFFTTLTAVTL
jgi:hypothetical protein